MVASTAVLIHRFYGTPTGECNRTYTGEYSESGLARTDSIYPCYQQRVHRVCLMVW